MAQETTKQDSAQGNGHVWIISQSGNGFQVYSPSDRTKVYTVSGTPSSPACTCDAHQWHKNDPEWKCEHIHAVFQQATGAEPRTDAPVFGQHRGGPAAPASNSSAAMALKRSVSPDGRIDSLSVEFLVPVECEDQDAEQLATQLLRLQSGIVTQFLNGAGSKPKQQSAPSPNGTVQAQLVSVGGMQTKWGWRTFINVSADGHPNLRLWGSRKQLAAQLTDAGYGHIASNLNNGTMLNVPCLAVLQPSDDGKYTNVEQILPPEEGG